MWARQSKQKAWPLAPQHYPIPFWTLTPTLLWGLSLGAGVATAAFAWKKSLFFANLPLALLVTGSTALFLVFHVRQVWARIMEYDPDEITTIPKSRGHFVLRRFPLALLLTLLPYLLVGTVWALFFR